MESFCQVDLGGSVWVADMTRVNFNVLTWGALISLVAIILLGASATYKYSGSWYVYTIYTIMATLLLANSFKKSAIFFDTFIGIYLWLGFWLKSTFRIAFANGNFVEPIGQFDKAPDSYDRVFIVATIAFFGVLISSGIRKKFFTYPSVSVYAGDQTLQFYVNNRKKILVAFVLALAAVTITNFDLAIYQRGVISKSAAIFGVDHIYKWLLLFGFASFATFIIKFEIEINKGLSWVSICIPILEGLLSNVSMLSRGMIINFGSYALGVYKFITLQKYRIDLTFLSFAGILFALAFLASVFFVNFIRDSFHYKQKVPVAIIKKENLVIQRLPEILLERSAVLLIDRWVGLEGLMAVSASDQLGMPMLLYALSEKSDPTKLSLYDTKFIKSPYDYLYEINEGPSKTLHYITLPGIVAFSYYSGSVFIVFLIIFAAVSFASMIEVFCYKFGGHNIIFCSLVGNVIAYRFIHFGYAPIETYKLFIAIVINILLFKLLNILLIKKPI